MPAGRHTWSYRSRRSDIIREYWWRCSTRRRPSSAKRSRRPGIDSNVSTWLARLAASPTGADEPGDAILDVLGRAATVGDHHAAAGRERLEDHVAGGFELRGVHEHVGRGEVVGNFRAADVAGEAHALAQAGGTSLLLQRRRSSPSPQMHQRRGRGDARQRIDEQVEPFSLLQRAGRDHHRTRDAEPRFDAAPVGAGRNASVSTPFSSNRTRSGRAPSAMVSSRMNARRREHRRRVAQQVTKRDFVGRIQPQP